jgi:hypothetical protein
MWARRKKDAEFHARFKKHAAHDSAALKMEAEDIYKYRLPDGSPGLVLSAAGKAMPAAKYRKYNEDYLHVLAQIDSGKIHNTKQLHTHMRPFIQAAKGAVKTAAKDVRTWNSKSGETYVKVRLLANKKDAQHGAERIWARLAKGDLNKGSGYLANTPLLNTKRYGAHVAWDGGKNKELAVIKQASAVRSILLKIAGAGFVPPPAVAAAAARGLELRSKASPSNKGGLTVSQAHEQGIGSGVQRAVDLKNRRALSPETIRRMVAFFSRHQKNKAIDPGKTPDQDKGYQAWLLWGGDPGRAWSTRIANSLRNEGEMSKKSTITKVAERPANMKEHLQNALAKYKAGKELGATEEARLKARGLIPRKDGSVHRGKLGMGKTASKSSQENVPTQPDLWAEAVQEAKRRFKIYPSAYANGWAAKWYKERGGSWKKA